MFFCGEAQPFVANVAPEAVGAAFGRQRCGGAVGSRDRVMPASLAVSLKRVGSAAYNAATLTETRVTSSASGRLKVSGAQP